MELNRETVFFSIGWRAPPRQGSQLRERVLCIERKDIQHSLPVFSEAIVLGFLFAYYRGDSPHGSRHYLSEWRVFKFDILNESVYTVNCV